MAAAQKMQNAALPFLATTSTTVVLATQDFSATVFRAKNSILAKIITATKKQNASRRRKFSRKTTTNAFVTTDSSATDLFVKKRDRSIRALEFDAQITLTRQFPAHENAPANAIKTSSATGFLFV